MAKWQWSLERSAERPEEALWLRSSFQRLYVLAGGRDNLARVFDLAREVSMVIRVTSLLWILAFLLSAIARAEDAKKEVEAVQGTWTVIGHAHNGRLAPAKNLIGHRFVFSGNEMQMVSPDWKTEFQIKLSGTKDPKSIEATQTDRIADSEPHRGIYKLEKDQLTIALDMRVKGSAKPDGFEAKKGSPVMVWVLKREKP
jgi:uncharacterized protein (TIGR03067 family)